MRTVNIKNRKCFSQKLKTTNRTCTFWRTNTKNRNCFSYKLLSHLILPALILATGWAYLINPVILKAAPQASEQTIYTGAGDSGLILGNISYSDIGKLSEASREAILYTGIFEIINAPAYPEFLPEKDISREEAIVAVLCMIGRQAEAGRLFDSYYQKNTKVKEYIEAAGYIQLASKLGLITKQKMTEALATDGEFLKSPVERQELAYYLAKALGLKPVYTSRKLLQNFKDNSKVDSLLAPYIETVLLSGIMNGSNGSFEPKGRVTRLQMAIIAKNAREKTDAINGLTLVTGIVKDIETTETSGSNNDIAGKIMKYLIECPDGSYCNINCFTSSENKSDFKTNEISNTTLDNDGYGLVVIKKGSSGDQTLLAKGDIVSFRVDKTGQVKYVHVDKPVSEEKNLLVQLISSDKTGFLTLSVIGEIPDMVSFLTGGAGISWNLNDTGKTIRISYSNDSFYLNNGKKLDLSKASADGFYIASITKSNKLASLTSTDYIANKSEKLQFTGIVEENYPDLGYMSIYPARDRNFPGGLLSQKETVLKYPMEASVLCYRNGEKTDSRKVQPGDSVFLETDEEGFIKKLSALTNLSYENVKVISIKQRLIGIQYNNGSQQAFRIDNSVPVYYEGKSAGIDKINPGDRLKIMLSKSAGTSQIKEIYLYRYQESIASVYRGAFQYADELRKTIVFNNVKPLYKGRFGAPVVNGIYKIKLSSTTEVYDDNGKIKLSELSKGYKGRQALIAVCNRYGEEQAVRVLFLGKNEILMSDNESIINVTSVQDRTISLYAEDDNAGMYGKVTVSDGAMLIYQDRLSELRSLPDGVTAEIAGGRDAASGSVTVRLIRVDKTEDRQEPVIYRTRIESVAENNSFSVMSFSRLEDRRFIFYNTSREFYINEETMLLTDEGYANISEFIDYGKNSYKGKTVYAACIDDNVLAISTAPFGPDSFTLSGGVYEVGGGTVDEDGNYIDQPNVLKLKDAAAFDTVGGIWNELPEISLDILKNTIIIKDNEIRKASSIRKEDRLEVFLKKDGESYKAYIIKVW